jgi:hypothetical protein
MERLQRRQALGLARLASVQRPNPGAIDEAGREHAIIALGGLAAQADAQAQDRQAHAAAAAELAAFRPGAEPAASQHRLILDVVGADHLLRRDGEAFHPMLAAGFAHPVRQGCCDIAAGLDVGNDFGRLRRGCGAAGRAALRRRSGGRLGRCLAGAGGGDGALRLPERRGLAGRCRRHGAGGHRLAFGQTHDLQLRRLALGVGGLVDRDQHLGGAAGDAHQGRAIPAAEPAIIPKAADGDRFRPEGRAGGERNPDAGQPGLRVRHRAAGRGEDAEQAGIEGHQMARHLELGDQVLGALGRWLAGLLGGGRLALTHDGSSRSWIKPVDGAAVGAAPPHDGLCRVIFTPPS